MTAERSTGGVIPSADETLLLRACVLGGDRAFEAWTRWSSGHTPTDAMQGQTGRLLPLIYKTIGDRLPRDDAWYAMLSTAHRATWITAQRRLGVIEAVAEALAAARLEAIVLKGAMLHLTGLRPAGTRTLGDIDLMIPAERVSDAVAALAQAGYTTDKPIGPGDIRYRHARPLQSDAGELDLHWRPAVELMNPQAAEALWSRAQAIPNAPAALKRLSPTDALFHTLVHGSRSTDLFAIQWAADAALLLDREGSKIDWPLFVESAGTNRLTARLAPMLAYLRDTLDQTVPDDVIDALRAIPPSRTERFEARVYSRRRVYGGGLLADFGQAMLQSLAACGRNTYWRPPLARLPHAVRFLAFRWSAELMESWRPRQDSNLRPSD